MSSVIGNWMKNHLISDSNCNVVNKKCPNVLQKMKNNVMFGFSVSAIIHEIYN